MSSVILALLGAAPAGSLPSNLSVRQSLIHFFSTSEPIAIIDKPTLSIIAFQNRTELKIDTRYLGDLELEKSFFQNQVPLFLILSRHRLSKTW